LKKQEQRSGKMEDKTEKKEPKRTRPNQIKFFVSDLELEKINKKIEKQYLTKEKY
jgi:hypothetical protein